MKFYDVWSIDPSNLIGEYATEDAALDVVRTLLGDGWRADELSLGWGESEDEDAGGTIATGGELLALVESAGRLGRSA